MNNLPMKKASLGILFIAILSLSSCKKNYVCYCEYYTNGTMTTTGTTPFNETKRVAKKKCKDLNDEGNIVFGGMNFHNETRCSLQ
jgi:hypothetical protein